MEKFILKMRKTRYQYLLLLLFFLTIGGLVHAQANLTVSLSTTPACSTDGSVNAVVTGGTPPYSYTWYTPQGTITTTVPTVTGSGGSYYLSASDANNGFGWGNATVPRPFDPTITPTPDVCGAGVGQAAVSIVGGTPPFTYLWSNGQSSSTATGLTAGTYTLTITDANGCYLTPQTDSSMYVYLWNTTPITFNTTATQSTCASGTASAVNVAGGTAPYSYQWSTTPPQFTPTATGLNSGSYQVTVSDAAGCSDVRWVWVPQGPNGLSGNISGTPETCIQSNGTATVNIFGGVPPITYMWSNGATTQSISGLSYGHYHVTATDAIGCPISKSVWIQRTEPLNLSFTAIQPACNNTGGSVTVNVTGGTPPYSYIWSNQATTQTISNLSTNYYNVGVTDANGCHDYNYHPLTMNPACYASISGTMVRDANADCIQNLGESGFANELVDLGNGYWAATSYGGAYQKTVLPGNYSLSIPNVPQYYAVGCPVGGSIALPGVSSGGNYTGNDFFLQPVGNAEDLMIWAWHDPARPTAPQTVALYYQNQGNTTVNGTINFTHDALMTVSNLGSALYNSGTRTLTWSLGPLAPGDQGSVYCEFTIPTNTQLGTAYTHSAEILPIVTDAAPTNNTWNISSVVVGSYDPNDKQVTPEGMLAPGVDSLLTYTIRFQNTGTDTAFTVAIRDTLDSDIDPFSIEILGASHSYIWDMDAPGYMTFTFDHIMLPDSHINEAASHGYVAYRARIKPNLPLGTEIKNTASIYFDYNAPVVTNTTLNTFGLVGTDPRQAADAGFTIHPNPTRGDVQIRLSEAWEGETEVSLMDLGGRKLRNWTVDALRDPSANLQLTGIPAGIYLLQCHDGIHQQVRKLVIQ